MLQTRDSIRTLSTWIQPQHLQEDVLFSYRKSFEEHPARFVVLKQFLTDPMAERLAKFLKDEAEFRSEYGLYSVEDEAVSEEKWQVATDEDRFFRLSKITGAPPQYRLSPNMLTYLQFRRAFQTEGFKSFFEELSGMELGWSDDFGSHSMKAGDFLRAHNDDNRNRRIALVIYLTPGWEPAFGGTLNIVDAQGRASKVEAEYNSMVVFDVAAGTTHFVEPIDPAAADRTRLTIGGWYHKPA